MTDFEPGARRIAEQVRDELSTSPPPGSVTVTLHPTIGEPEPGHWCDHCLLPSAFEATLTGLHRGGAIPLGRIKACGDCGWIERVTTPR